ncbi:MAG: hypothetical protein ABI333_12990 [bacterium]
MSLKRAALVALIAAASLLAGATTAHASMTRWYRGQFGPATTDPAAQVARDFVAQHAQRLGLDRVQLAPDPRVIDWRGHRIVRFAQEYEGLPVFTTVVVVRLDRQGRVRTVVTDAHRALDVITTPVTSAAEAHVTAAWQFGLDRLGAPKIELGVLPGSRHGRLVWRVEGSQQLRRVAVFVDALTGQPRMVSNLSYDAEGRVYRENPTSTPATELLTLGNLPVASTHLNGDYITTFRYVDGSASGAGSIEELTLDQTATADGNGDFDYQPTTDASAHFDDSFAEVNVYWHADDMYTYYRDQHGYSTSHEYVSLANVGSSAGSPYENAFFTPIQWNGSQAYGLFMGQANTVDLGYDGDVIRHEFSHSVIHDLTNMGYGPAALPVYDTLGANPAPSAIHEGMADFFACTVTDDPVMGEYSLDALGGSSRNQVNTLTCPGSMVGEGHADGVVWGGAAWAVRTELGDAATADSMLYGALATLSSYATFKDYAVAVQDVAAAMVTDGDITQAQADAVTNVLDVRGMSTCGRAIDMRDNQPLLLTNTFTYGAIAQMMGSACQNIRSMGFPALPLLYQFRMPVGANATTLSFTIEFSPATDLRYDIFVRRGDLVRFELVSVYGQFSLPDPSEFDHHFGTLTAASQTITFNANSSPPLVPGVDYYFAITNENCDQGFATITVDTDSVATHNDAGVGDGSVSGDASGTDAGPGTDDPKSGCSCTQPGPSTPPLSLLFFALVLGWIIRRR